MEGNLTKVYPIATKAILRRAKFHSIKLTIKIDVTLVFNYYGVEEVDKKKLPYKIKKAREGDKLKCKGGMEGIQPIDNHTSKEC